MASEIKILDCPTVAAPAGHYAHATATGGLVYVSGQLPLGPDGSYDSSSTFEDQARLAIGNLLAILASAGCKPTDIVKCTAYIVGVENWKAFNTVYGAVLGGHRPARTVVPVEELHHGCLVEIDAIAVQPA